MTPWISTNVAFPFTEHGGEVDLLLGIPGKKPPPPNVAPPFAFTWLPITPSIVVSMAVQETAVFHDGSEPGATVVPWTENGYASSRDVEIIRAVSSTVPANAMFRFVGVRVAPCTFVTTSISTGREGTGVFVQSVYKRLENNTLRTPLSSYPGKSDYAKCNPTTPMEFNLPLRKVSQ